MSPKGQCVNCLCRAGFNGKLVEPFCRRRSCGFELFEAVNIANNCAVAYSISREDGKLCCPRSFVCRK